MAQRTFIFAFTSDWVGLRQKFSWKILNLNQVLCWGGNHLLHREIVKVASANGEVRLDSANGGESEPSFWMGTMYPAVTLLTEAGALLTLFMSWTETKAL